MSTQKIAASKYHSNGNDFMVVAPAQVQEDHYAALTRAICEDHFGLGADGCVFVGEIPAFSSCRSCLWRSPPQCFFKKN